MAMVQVPASSGWKVALEAVVPGADGGGWRGASATARPLGECAVTSISSLLGAPRKIFNTCISGWVPAIKDRNYDYFNSTSFCNA